MHYDDMLTAQMDAAAEPTNNTEPCCFHDGCEDCLPDDDDTATAGERQLASWLGVEA